VGVVKGSILELLETSSSFIAVVNPSRAIGEIDEGDAASLGGEGSIEVWMAGDVVEEETIKEEEWVASIAPAVMGVECADICYKSEEGNVGLEGNFVRRRG